MRGKLLDVIKKLNCIEGFISHSIHEFAHPDIFSKYGSLITKEQGNKQLTEVIERHEHDLKKRLEARTRNKMNQG